MEKQINKQLHARDEMDEYNVPSTFLVPLKSQMKNFVTFVKSLVPFVVRLAPPKKSLEIQWYRYHGTEVAAGIENTSSACSIIFRCVAQTAE